MIDMSDIKNLDAILGEIHESIVEVNSKSVMRDKDNSAAYMALVSLLKDKGIISLDEFEKEKRNLRKELD